MFSKVFVERPKNLQQEIDLWLDFMDDGDEEVVISSQSQSFDPEDYEVTLVIFYSTRKKASNEPQR